MSARGVSIVGLALLLCACDEDGGRDPSIGAMSGAGGQSGSGGKSSTAGSGGQSASGNGGSGGGGQGGDAGAAGGGAAGDSGSGGATGGSSGTGGSGGGEVFPPNCTYHTDPPADPGGAGAAGAAGASAGPAITVQTSATAGNYLADAAGRPLYMFTTDAAGDCTSPPQSRCVDACEAEWPIFDAAPRTLDARLNDGDFGQIDRASGAPVQTTYRGWPLYYSAADTMAGQTTGHNRGRVWFLARLPMYSVLTMRVDTVRPIGDGTGRVLYTFDSDQAGAGSAPPVSACTGACLADFPAFNPSHLTITPSIESSSLGTFLRSDGQLQVSYMGRPLYYARSAAQGTIPATLPMGWTPALP